MNRKSFLRALPALLLAPLAWVRLRKPAPAESCSTTACSGRASCRNSEICHTPDSTLTVENLQAAIREMRESEPPEHLLVNRLWEAEARQLMESYEVTSQGWFYKYGSGGAR